MPRIGNDMDHQTESNSSAMQRPAGEGSLNQCDGCRRRLPLRGLWPIHFNPEVPWDLIACTADRYQGAPVSRSSSAASGSTPERSVK